MTLEPTQPGPFSLAIETSATRGGLALGRGPDLVGLHPIPSLAGHAADLLPAIDQLCRTHHVQPADIGQVFVSRGPGSFTGLRIGVTVAKMFALAAGARVVAVPSMTAIAQNARAATPHPQLVAVLLDAHRASVYAATFRLQGPCYEPTSEPVEADPAAFLAGLPTTCVLLGAGTAVHKSAVAASGLDVLPEECHAPRPEVIYELGHAAAAKGSFDDARRLVPHYVRRAAAEEKWDEKQQAEGKK